MSTLTAEFAIAMQRAAIHARLQRRPFLKVVEGTENNILPLYYDPRSEEIVLYHICLRMRNKLKKYKLTYYE